MMLLENKDAVSTERAGRSEPPWPVASLARAPGCRLSRSLAARAAAPVAAAGPDRTGQGRGGDHVAVWW